MVLRTVFAAAMGIALLATPQDAEADGQVEIGRYQILINERGGTAILLDSVTGRSWILSSPKDRKWSDLDFGQTKDGHPILTPLLCTEKNPSCYFPAQESAQ
jgi:hypothetical protein